jgi:hypothetical protein
MVGIISGPTEFTPNDAIILQNKDEVIIPLLLNELPTAKEFKDAISSLSPEQQRFAKSFRGMQLESSVFGVCVVQLKPQLEVLLGLPPDALTKEIRLTQDLLSLFIDYQIPSDLLSFDGEPNDAVADKVGAVKAHVKAVLEVIQEAKKKQLQDVEMKAEMNVFQTLADFDPPRTTESMIASAALDVVSEPLGFSERSDRQAKSEKKMSKRRVRSEQQMPRATPQGNIISRSYATELSPSSRRLIVSGDGLGAVPASVGSEGEILTPPSSLKAVEQMTLPNVYGAAPQADGMVDFTAIPKQLDAKFDVHDADSALRATIIKADRVWKRSRQENLLTKALQTNLFPEQIKLEKDKAFDLLDALSRSGSLPIACAELHVVVAVTHCFENDVMGTVIKDNANPIEKVEKTMLLMASTIHGVEPPALIENQAQSTRLMQNFPALFAPPQADEE